MSLSVRSIDASPAANRHRGSRGVDRVAAAAPRPVSPRAGRGVEIPAGRCACGGTCPRCRDSAPVEPKLTISEPGDPSEQEADRLAGLAMARHAISTSPPLERVAGQGVRGLDTRHPTAVQALPGSGQSLEPALRQEMEGRFGYDFSRVRLHTGSAADRSARHVNAAAYTVGRDIVFAAGQFAPRTHQGQRLIAHELVHVIQAGDGRLGPNVIARIPRESKIEDETYSYSTHCGWIDWGHSNPENARNLIAVVREASQRMERKEAVVAAINASTPPALVAEPACPSGYDETESAASTTEPVTVGTEARASGVIEVRIGGFGVDSAETAKAAEAVEQLAEYIDSMQHATGTRYGVVVSGFSDCIGVEQRNVDLRHRRRDAVTSMLTSALAGRGLIVPGGIAAESHDPDQYLASNASRSGRSANRGVLVRLLPQAQAEQIRPIPPVEVRLRPIPQLEVGPLDSAVAEATLNRSLSEDEALSVALSIFMIESQLYEWQQAWAPFPIQSSFSEEDLPSNMIGFYRAARGYSSLEIRGLCDAWDVPRSVAVFQGYQFVDNQTFRPPHLPPGGQWPTEFQTVQPALPPTELFDFVQIVVENPLFNARCDFSTGRLQCR